MSLETLDILNNDKKNQIELSPFSETFQIVGGVSFIGIFDDAYDTGMVDGGNVTQRSTCPAIMVVEEPTGLIKGSEIERESGELFTWRRNGTDSEGVPVVFLYKV